MLQQGRFTLISLLLLSSLLCSCLGSVWTGATTVYDRHNMYKKLKDYHIMADINKVLAKNRTFQVQGCSLDIVVFNGDILLAGHLPSSELDEELRRRMAMIKGYGHLFYEVKVFQSGSNSAQDSWITTKIRSRIFADSSIDPNTFKVTTSDRIVYLMGDVKVDEAEKVIEIARSTAGVQRVVKLLRYFTYQAKSVA